MAENPNQNMSSNTLASTMVDELHDEPPSFFAGSDQSWIELTGKNNPSHDDDPEEAAAASFAPSRPDNFPDGGVKAWLVVLGGWCCLFVSFGWITSIGVFQDYYQSHQLRDYSSSEVAWIPALQAFMMFAGAPFFGKIFDNYGPRHLVFFGTIFHVFGLMMVSLSSTYWQILLSQGICSSLGASATFYAAINSGSTWFDKRRALALGVESSGSSIGGVIFPLMIYHLLPKIGFGWTMRVVAFLILGLLIVGNLTVRSNITPHRSPFKLMEFVAPLKEGPFQLVTLGNFLFIMVNLVPPNFIVLQGQHEGMSTSLSQNLLPIFNAASVFGRILPAWAGDRFGRFNVMIITAVVSAIVVLALWIPAHENATIILFAIFFGFSSGAYVSLSPALVAQISDLRHIGVRLGTNFFIVAFAALTGNPIAGAILAKDNGNYLGLQIFCGVTILASAVAYLGSRNLQCGFKWKKI